MVSRKDKGIEDRLMFLADCAVNGNIPEDPQEIRQTLQKYMGKDFGDSWAVERSSVNFGRLLAWPFHVLAAPGIIAFGLAGSAINAVAEKFTKRELFDLSWMDRAPPFEREDGSSVFSVMETYTETSHLPISKMSDERLKDFLGSANFAAELTRGLYDLLPSNVGSNYMRSIKGEDWDFAQELLNDNTFKYYGMEAARDAYLAKKLGHVTDKKYIDDETEALKTVQREQRQCILNLVDLQDCFKDNPCALRALKSFVEDGVRKDDMPGVNMETVFMSYLKEAYAEGARKKEKHNPHGGNGGNDGNEGLTLPGNEEDHSKSSNEKNNQKKKSSEKSELQILLAARSDKSVGTKAKVNGTQHHPRPKRDSRVND